jgi:hypothetical protein
LLLLGLFGCGQVYDESGRADPGSWWSWVCEDGGPIPDSGCLPGPSCPDGEVVDTDGGC